MSFRACFARLHTLLTAVFSLVAWTLIQFLHWIRRCVMVTIYSQVYHIFFISPYKSRRQVFIDRPVFRFPCGFHVTAHPIVLTELFNAHDQSTSNFFVWFQFLFRVDLSLFKNYSCWVCLTISHSWFSGGIYLRRSKSERGSSAVECRTRNLVCPGSNALCYRFVDWAFPFSPLTPQLTQLFKWVPCYRQWWKCEWFSLRS